MRIKLQTLENSFKIILILIFILFLGAATVVGSYKYYDNLYIGGGFDDTDGGATLDYQGNADFTGTITADTIIAENLEGTVVDIPIDIEDLDNVSVTAYNDKDILYYNSGVFTNGPITSDLMDDFTFSSLTLNDLLIFNGTEFQNIALSGDISINSLGEVSYEGYLNDLLDVTIVTPIDNHALLYDNGTWYNRELNSSYLNDVNRPIPYEAGQLLINSGTVWENVSLSGDGTLNSSGELTINIFDGTNPGLVPTGDISQELFLCVDGTYKVPSVGVVTGTGSSTDNAVTVWDGTSGDAIKNSTIMTSETGDLTIPGVLTVGSNPTVLTNAVGYIDGGKIQDQTVSSNQLTLTGVTADQYSAVKLTVDSAGRITNILGNSTELIDLGNGETTYGLAGQPLIVNSTVDGWEWASVIDLTYLPVLIGDSGSGGNAGIVPSPEAGDATAGKYLFADGTWKVPTGTGNVSGPASSTDNAIVLFDGTDGQTIMDSTIVSSNGSDFKIPGTLTVGSSEHLLTNSAGLIDGGKIQASSISRDRISIFNIGDLSDVDITSPLDNYFITYNSASMSWESSNISATSFIVLDDTPSAYTDQAGKYPIVNSTEDALEFSNLLLSALEQGGATDSQVLTWDSTNGWQPEAPGTGVTTYIALNDTPSAYTDQEYKLVRVNSTADALEFSNLKLDIIDHDGATDGQVITWDDVNGWQPENADSGSSTFIDSEIIPWLIVLKMLLNSLISS